MPVLLLVPVPFFVFDFMINGTGLLRAGRARAGR